MSDDLPFAQVPEAKSDDPEDVSWALSTAEAMWARGDHSEAIRWVRRAAEAASEAENDARALELAKAAADLAGLIARQSTRSSIELEEVVPATPPPVPSARPGAGKPAQPSPSVIPPSPVPKPSSLGPAAPGKKGSRRPRENLDAEARAAAQAAESVTHLAPEPATARRLPADTGETLAVQVPHRRRSRPEVGNSDPTIVGHVNDLANHAATDEWDAASVSASNGGDRMTVVSAPPTPKMTTRTPAARPAGSPQTAAASSMLTQGAANAPARTAPNAPHDPGIMTSQAVRVVVWRDANGVHVAPAGTVVSAITVDAMLVALDPSADLTAWLGTGGPQRR